VAGKSSSESWLATRFSQLSQTISHFLLKKRPGGPPPYRINVDSGVVFMCITSLAPVAPLIAPFATLYYMIFIPMLRWLNIFVYRPKVRHLKAANQSLTSLSLSLYWHLGILMKLLFSRSCSMTLAGYAFQFTTR
jgi:hypothetical protein